MENPGDRSEAAPQFPDWLANLVVDISEHTPVEIGNEGKAIPGHVLMGALYAPVDSGAGAMSVPPEMAQLLAELAEKPGWKRFAPESCLAWRKGDNEWEITIGDSTTIMSREEVFMALVKALWSPV
jgi:hypothetical protein